MDHDVLPLLRRHISLIPGIGLQHNPEQNVWQRVSRRVCHGLIPHRGSSMLRPAATPLYAWHEAQVWAPAG